MPLFTRLLVVTWEKERGITVKFIAEALKRCRTSVENHLKMKEEQQTFVPAAEKCRNTRVQRNAVFTNMEQKIYHAIACENSLISLEIQDIVREKNNTGVSTATMSRKFRKMRRWIESARLQEPFI
ncbi:hypothetical protein RF11_06768 [Thelohanellus kitauei]|uniref:Uncharacterized protein n=1 Tax=Thelohanellus kitauei TaxID=669202 RepID=A0A0C2IS97_THEKT|nr:hypothetical protein RF11_06768 [Thelohanellus kitauei]